MTPTFLSDALLLLVLGGATLTDLRSRRIPNGLVGGALLLGVLYATVLGGLSGLLHSLGGALLGLLLFMPFFALRWMGAGDVKLLAAAGSFTGAPQIALLALLAALCGGVMGAMVIAAGGRTGRVFRLPYAAALLAGALCSMVLR